MSRQPEQRQSLGESVTEDLAWEISNAIRAIPFLIAVVVLAQVLSWSFNQTLLSVVVASILYRVFLWGILKIRSSE